MIDRRALVLGTGMFAIGTDAFVVAGILPEIARDLGVTLEGAGWVVSTFSLSYAVGSPVAVALSERYRRRAVLSVSLAVFALANLLSAISSSLPLLLVTRVVAGASAGLFAPSALAVGATLGQAQNRGKTMAVVVAGFTTAIVLGVPLGVAIGQYATWRGALLFVAMVAAVALVAVLRTGVPEPDGTGSAISLRQRVRPIFRPRVLAALLPFVVWSIANYSLFTFVAPLQAQHLPTRALPWLMLFFGVGGVAGNLTGGRLYDSYGTSRATPICLSFLIAVLALAGIANAWWLPATIQMLCWAMCQATLYVLQQQRAMSIEPRQAGLTRAQQFRDVPRGLDRLRRRQRCLVENVPEGAAMGKRRHRRKRATRALGARSGRTHRDELHTTRRNERRSKAFEHRTHPLKCNPLRSDPWTCD
jgi:DHA1 family inner membrane transport protein